MKPGLFAGVVLAVVLLQTTLTDSLSFLGIRPDLCLVAVCVIGFSVGQWNGLRMGLTVGFLQDLFSAGELWVNLITKAGVGFLSGLIASHLTNTTPRSVFLPVVVLSLFSGVVYLVSSKAGLRIEDIVYGLRSMLLPQAVLDGILAVGLTMVLARWLPQDSGM